MQMTKRIIEKEMNSLQTNLNEAAFIFGEETRTLDSELAPQQMKSVLSVVSECHEHTNHMEAALASSGPYMASLDRDILPEIFENSEKLEDLFAIIDKMNDEILPQVEEAISRMESVSTQLNHERASLEPSKLKQVISYFGTKRPSSPPVPRPAWKSPEIFNVNELMSTIKVSEENYHSNSLSEGNSPSLISSSPSSSPSSIHPLSNQETETSSPLPHQDLVTIQALDLSDEDSDEVEVI
mmetsp:Transcript_10239/g.12422  ORF Transcript_10239/g.12422 Transcript_10239/m.12422 type:complete len:240 (+) Transcript_10239:16-735(+)